MKTHAIAAAVLVAACVTPRSAVEESALDEAPGESGAGAPCSQQEPCALEVYEVAKRRVALEAETEAKMARAGENAQTRKVADAWTKGLARSIEEEKDQFAKWCETAQGWNADKRGTGARGLTREDMQKRTGPPPQESKVESADGSVDGKTWIWEAEGAISKSVSFVILFQRPAGTEDPWVFGGCQWCASGGPATTRGCVTLPAGK